MQHDRIIIKVQSSAGQNGNNRLVHISVRFPLAAWSSSIASNRDLKFPAPNPCEENNSYLNIEPLFVSCIAASLLADL